MNTALIDYYRCPESFANIKLKGRLSEDAGYFRFGLDTIYGRSASGFRASRPTADLYDAGQDVSIEDLNAFLPFDPTEVIGNLRLEHYARHHGHEAFSLWQRSIRNTYYFFRPFIHLHLRRHLQRAHLNSWRNLIFPHWPVDTTVENLCEKFLFLLMKAQGAERVPFVWFWPDGAEACISFTHDVEGEDGKNFCQELMDIDDSFGFKAAFQLVPEGRYDCSRAFVESIRSRGFEVNIQDLNHDGHLFRSQKEFLRRVSKINEYGRSFQARGFRSAVLYRNLDWYDKLEFSFDMSVPNVAHLDPQRGGCCTVMPYFVGDVLEVPVTTTQDYALFHLLHDYSLDLWKEQLALILEKNGIASFIVHPDYIIEEKARGLYKGLLSFLREAPIADKLWFAVAGEVDHWWRQRRNMSLVNNGGKWEVHGLHSERARVAYARLAKDRIEYEVEDQSR